MNNFYYYIIITLTIVILVSSFSSFIYRRRLKHMHRTVLSMALSMNINLSAGVLLGSLYMDNLLLSTILSICLGILISLLIGISFGLVSVIEGMMSGIMGGMMGAMLGAMLQSSQSATMLNVLLVLTFCALLLFFILPETKEQKKYNNRWLFRPFITLIISTVYLIFGYQLNIKVFQNDLNKNHKLSFEVNASSNFQFDPAVLRLTKNQPISIILNNTDKIEHDIEIKKITIKKEKNYSHNHQTKSDIHLHALPNSKSKISFTPLEAGTYEFYCTIPGHKESGMKGIVIVNEKI